MYGRFDFVQHLSWKLLWLGLCCTLCCTAVVMWYCSLLTSSLAWNELKEEEHLDVRRLKKSLLLSPLAHTGPKCMQMCESTIRPARADMKQQLQLCQAAAATAKSGAHPLPNHAMLPVFVTLLTSAANFWMLTRSSRNEKRTSSQEAMQDCGLRIGRHRARPAIPQGNSRAAHTNKPKHNFHAQVLHRIKSTYTN